MAKRTKNRLVGRLAIAMVALLYAACSDEAAPPESDTKTLSDTAAVDTQPEAGPTDAGEPRYQRWLRHAAPHDEKLRAIAVRKGQAGHYAMVGDGGTVVLFEDGVWKDISPTNIGGADLAGVHVDDTGRTIIAGDKSALAIRDKGTWLVAGEVPPAPAVRFLDVNGVGTAYWAVGESAQAWLFDDGSWTSQAVTVTDDSEAIGPGARFVAVSVTKDEVWIACDPGVKSPGLALRKTKTGWTSYPLKTAPRDIWVAPDKLKGGVLVAGGTASEYVARFDGKAFVAETGLKWQQGFHAVRGLSAAQVWASGLKGQLRRSTKGEWEVVLIEAPPGTPKPFPPPTDDLIGVAVHSADELAVITTYKMYRYGKQ